MTIKFKVGDRVRIKSKSTSSCYSDWLKNYGKKSEYTIDYISDVIGIGGNHFLEKDLELVEEDEKFMVIPPDFYADMILPYLTKEINKQTIMSKITTFAKNLVLSADEKLLRKYGLHTECGEATEEATDLVIAKLVKENESYLIELATAMQAEEAKK